MADMQSAAELGNRPPVGPRPDAPVVPNAPQSTLDLSHLNPIQQQFVREAERRGLRPSDPDYPQFESQPSVKQKAESRFGLVDGEVVPVPEGVSKPEAVSGSDGEPIEVTSLTGGNYSQERRFQRWRYEGVDDPNKRERVIKGAGAAAATLITGIFGWDRLGRPGLPKNSRTLVVSGTQAHEDIVEAPINIQEYSSNLGNWKQRGWTISGDLNQIRTSMMATNASDATVSIHYNDAIVNIPSRIEFSENNGQFEANPTENAREGELLALPVNGDQATLTVAVGEGKDNFELPLASQEYNIDPKNKRVFVEIFDDNRQPIDQEIIQQIQQDAEAMNVLGLDAYVFSPNFEYQGKIQIGSEDTHKLGVVTPQRSLLDGTGRLHAFESLAKEVVDGLSNQNYYDSETIGSFNDQIEMIRDAKRLYEGTLPEIGTTRNRTPRDARPNIFSISHYFPDFKQTTPLIHDTTFENVHELIGSELEVFRLVDFEKFAVEYRALDERQAPNAAKIINHTLNIFEKVAAYNKKTLADVLPNAGAFRGLTTPPLS